MKTRKLSLRTKITLVIASLSVVSFCIFGLIAYKSISTKLIDQIKAEALHIAEIAASEVDGDVFTLIESEEDEQFSSVYDSLVKYRDSDAVEYVYTMKKTGPEQAVFVVDTDPDEPGEVGEEYEWLDVFETVSSGTSAWDDEITVDEWGSVISGYAPIFCTDGSVAGWVGVDVSLEDIEKDISIVRILIIVLIAIFCGVFVLISLGIGLILGKDLKRLYIKVHDLNGAEADLTKQIRITSGDELETIAGEFNTFIDHIHDQMKGAAGTSDIVAANSESMEELVEECRSGLSDIASELHALSESMRNTTVDTTAIVKGINDSREIVERAFENANSKAEEANRISCDAGEMEKNIARKTDHATQMAATLKEKLEEAAEKCQAVHEIEELADRILKVSSTTKMLSLNASIEAARAGEAGRGFAIIAGDVQNLSSQITDLVELIRQTNEQVIISVEGLIENVNVTTGFLSDDVLPDYREFSRMGADYSTNMSGMSDALREINENLEKVNASMDMIRDRADSINTVISDSSHQIDTVATGSTELEGNMNDLSERAIKNNDEARSLNRNISEYKL